MACDDARVVGTRNDVVFHSIKKSFEKGLIKSGRESQAPTPSLMLLQQEKNAPLSNRQQVIRKGRVSRVETV